MGEQKSSKILTFQFPVCVKIGLTDHPVRVTIAGFTALPFVKSEVVESTGVALQADHVTAACTATFRIARSGHRSTSVAVTV